MSNEMNLPWDVYRINSIRGSIIDSERSTVTNHIDPARAAHIVKCVNNHDALVAALETVLANAPEPYCAITRAVDRQVREVLAAARGEL